MNKVLIDRELLERAIYALERAIYALERAYEPDMLTTRDIAAVLATPSGTPAMPVKAYYHEAQNEHGGLNKSVGLEVRKAFIDAPLVLESDALARIACLEGEIAKRDGELAACRVAVENCDLFRARIAELESRYQRDVCGLNNEGDPIGGDPAGGYANDNARLRAELSDAQAIIDGLRGEVEVMTQHANNYSRMFEECAEERDQQAQRIGELEGLLRHAQKQVPTGSGLHMRIDALLSAGKEGA